MTTTNKVWSGIAAALFATSMIMAAMGGVIAWGMQYKAAAVWSFVIAFLFVIPTTLSLAYKRT